MSKPTKTAAELIAMARTELKAHVDVRMDWRFRDR